MKLRRLPLMLTLCAALLLAACRREPQPDAEALFAAGNYPMAILAASAGLEQHPEPSSAAELHSLIADCHRSAGNFDAALAYARMAARTDTASEDMRLGLARAYIEAAMADSALALLAADSSADALRLRAEAALDGSNRALADTLLERLHADREWMSPRLLTALADVYRRNGMPDSAATVIARVDTADSTPETLRALAAYYSSTTPTLANRLYSRAAALQDSAARSAAAAGIYGRLYAAEHERLAEQSRRSRILLMAVAIIASLLIAAIALNLYLRASSRRKLLEAENRLLAAADETRRLSEQSRSTIGRLFRESYNSIEMAANLLIDSDASRSGAEGAMRRLRAQIDDCRTPQFLARLEEAVNAGCNNVIARMRRDVAPLSDSEITVALYCAAGLSPRVICLLLDCTPSALYNKKYRLRRKIQDSAALADAKEEYLQSIS